MKKWNQKKPQKTESKKVLFVDFQIITFSQAKVKKHLSQEDTAELYSKPKLN